MNDRGKAAGAVGLPLAMGWGVGTLGISVMFNTSNFLLLRYMTDFLGIAAASAGLILLLAKLYDAVTDPLMGVISDRTRSPWGRRRPWLLLGGLVCALAFTGLFNAAEWVAMGSAIAVMLGLSLLYSTGYTLFNVPYMAMPAEMSEEYHERSFLVQFRVYAIALGTLAGGFGAPWLVQHYGGGADGHAAMGKVLGVFILLTSIACFFATRGARATEPSTTTALPWRERVKLFLDNRPFLLLIGVKFFQLMALAVSQAVLSYFILRILALDYGFMGRFLLLSSVAMFAATPVWLRLSRRRGKVWCYLVASAIYAVVAASWYWAGAGDPEWQFQLRALVSGFASGGMLLMGQAMLPDTIAWDARRSGQQREGVFAGVYTSAEKMAFAVGAALSGMFLGAMGYIESTGGGAAQPDSAILAIRLSMSLLPTLLTAISCAFLLPYDLDESRLHANVTPESAATTA